MDVCGIQSHGSMICSLSIILESEIKQIFLSGEWAGSGESPVGHHAVDSARVIYQHEMLSFSGQSVRFYLESIILLPRCKKGPVLRSQVNVDVTSKIRISYRDSTEDFFSKSITNMTNSIINMAISTINMTNSIINMAISTINMTYSIINMIYSTINMTYSIIKLSSSIVKLSQS